MGAETGHPVPGMRAPGSSLQPTFRGLDKRPAGTDEQACAPRRILAPEHLSRYWIWDSSFTSGQREEQKGRKAKRNGAM